MRIHFYYNRSTLVFNITGQLGLVTLLTTLFSEGSLRSFKSSLGSLSFAPVSPGRRSPVVYRFWESQACCCCYCSWSRAISPPLLSGIVCHRMLPLMPAASPLESNTLREERGGSIWATEEGLTQSL